MYLGEVYIVRYYNIYHPYSNRIQVPEYNVSCTTIFSAKSKCANPYNLNHKPQAKAVRKPSPYYISTSVDIYLPRYAYTRKNGK